MLTLPSPLFLPKSVWFGSHLRGNLWGLEQPQEESRGKNMGQLSLTELQLCHPEMETALVTSGNDIPSAHSALGLSRTKGPALEQRDWAGTELSWWCSPFLCDLRRSGEVVINCSLVIEGITGSRHPFFSLALLCKRPPQICQCSCFLTWFCQEDMG